MPKKAIDYSKTIIYKLVCKDTTITDLYVGSTTSFVDRKKTHKDKAVCSNEYDKSYHLKVYDIIRANGGWTNWEMVMVECFPCENKLQAHQRERYWLETLHATMNSNIPSRTTKEYYENNKHNIAEKRKEYYAEHIDKVKEQHRNGTKKWRERNPDKVREYKKKYHAAKKEQIKNIA
jgi:hypothetical protein